MTSMRSGSLVDLRRVAGVPAQRVSHTGISPRRAQSQMSGLDAGTLPAGGDNHGTLWNGAVDLRPDHALQVEGAVPALDGGIPVGQAAHPQEMPCGRAHRLLHMPLAEHASPPMYGVPPTETIHPSGLRRKQGASTRSLARRPSPSSTRHACNGPWGRAGRGVRGQHRPGSDHSRGCRNEATRAISSRMLILGGTGLPWKRISSSATSSFMNSGAAISSRAFSTSIPFE